MELDYSIWDEDFFSIMVPHEELDYEFDENDFTNNVEDTPQGTIKHEDSGVSSFMQPNLDSTSSFDNKNILVQAEIEKKPILGNKHGQLEDQSFINRQNSINSEFSDCSVKTENERRNSTDFCSNSNEQIIIDARIFLNPDNRSLNSVSANSITNDKSSQPNSNKHESITSHNQSQQIDENSKIKSTKSIHKSHSKREKLEDFVIPHVDKKCKSAKEKSTVKTADKKKHISDTHKEKLKKRHTADFDKRKYKEHTKDAAKNEKKRQESLKFHPFSTLPPVDPGRKYEPDNRISKSTDTKREEYSSTAFSKEGKKYQSDKRKTNDELHIKNKKHGSSVLFNVGKKCANEADSEIRRSKKFGSVHCNSDKMRKLKKNIKVEPDVLLSQKESNKGDSFGKVKIEENVKFNIGQRNNSSNATPKDPKNYKFPSESLKFNPFSTVPPVDPGRKYEPDNRISKSTDTKREEYSSTAFSKEGKKYQSDKRKTNDELHIKNKKHCSSVLSNIDKKCANEADSEIRRSKKFGSVHCNSDKMGKLKKKIKVEPDVLLSQKESNKGDSFEKVEIEENVKFNIGQRNNSSNATPKDPKKHKFPSDETNILKCGSNLKTEPTLNSSLFNAKLVLEKLPNEIVHSVPVHTDTAKPKEEVLDQKPVLRLNLLNMKARVVLKKLTEADLRSPASLLSRVKTEINESISQRLRSEGKARNKDFIHLYCCQCKSLRMERSGLSKTKNCENCDSQFIYLCIKCNEKHYVGYYQLQRHLKTCRGSGETKLRALDSIVLHRCTQCTFKTTRPELMASHVKRKGHKADGEIIVDKVPKSPKVRVKREVSNEPTTSPKVPRTRYAKLIIKQSDTSVASTTERYCIKCDEPRSLKTRKPKESCHRCETDLYLRCLKCSLKCSKYHVMLRHLRKKCQPNEFKCAKCDYTNSMWSLMQQHVMEDHDNQRGDNKLSKSGRKGKGKKRCREVFGCSLCDFRTYYQHSVTRHMKRLHKN